METIVIGRKNWGYEVWFTEERQHNMLSTNLSAVSLDVSSARLHQLKTQHISELNITLEALYQVEDWMWF